MLTTKGSTTINSLSYTYDNNGNILTYTRDGEVTTYTYDLLDRLLTATYPDSTSVTYTYDALNNLTKETFSNGDVKEYFYNKKYQLSEIKLNGNVTDTYTYNSTGAVISHNDETFTYKYGWGRADLISNSGEVWDVKRDKPKQIAAGVAQVQKYTANTWKNRPTVDLKTGGTIASGEFVHTINIDTYYISYRYAGNGVIAYDYYKVTDWNAVKSYATAAGMTALSALVFFLSQGAVQLQPAY